MVALIEKELKIRDQELEELVKNLSMDTMPNISSKVDSLTAEKQMLHKLLKQQKIQRRSNLFAMENGLLLFAIAMFGALAAFVFYIVPEIGVVEGTWEQMGSDLAVLVLLIVMTSISTALYLHHYKRKLSR
jgi:hypothetical protein